MTSASHPGRWWPRLFLAACLLAVLYILTFPLQDYDTFWHMAYGRAMVESRSYIVHEIFSYTAHGKFVPGHSQLAQVLLYLVWAVGSANLLLGFKLLAGGIVFLLIMSTARICGAGTIAGSALGLAVLTMGMGRVVERPEIFTILLQALLIWVLFRARHEAYPHRWLWSLPPVMVVWDYLHGGVYGFVILCAFVAGEACRAFVLPRIGLSRFAGVLECTAVKRFVGWFLATILAMSVHPNGLLDYRGFLQIRDSSLGFTMYAEWMPPYSEQFYPYWIFLGCIAVLILCSIRRIDLTALAVMLPFLYLSLTYNRAVLAFGLAAVPATSQALAGMTERLRGFRFHKVLTLLLATGLLAGTVLYKHFWVIETHRFGVGISDIAFPVGSARFVADNQLSGNMYNMDAFGGYLAFMLGPERKIFNYNQPGVFTALFDYLHKPETRPQWNIRYALIGRNEEINLFKRDGFVPVYWEPGCAVFVRPGPENAALIEKFRLQYFRPLMSDGEIIALGMNQGSAQRMLEEVGIYLRYREDRRIARLFAQLLRTSPGAGDDRQKAERLVTAVRYNESSTELLAVYAETLYRLGNLDRAEALFQQVLERDGSSFPALIGLGYVYYDRSRFAEAREHFSKLVDWYPDAADAHYALGLAALRLCEQKQARAAFERFLELAPGSPYAGKAKAFMAENGQRCDR